MSHDAATWAPCMGALCRLVDIGTMLCSGSFELHVERAMLVSVLEQPRLDEDYSDTEDDIMGRVLSVQAMPNENPIISMSVLG
jgi:hypothetical protein